jgi:hypothetical protein
MKSVTVLERMIRMKKAHILTQLSLSMDVVPFLELRKISPKMLPVN